MEQNPLPQLIESHQFEPVVQQVSGGREWTIRIRFHNGVPVFHLMNTALRGVPHPTTIDSLGRHILLDIDSTVTDGKLSYRLKLDISANIQYELMSPETGDKRQSITIKKEEKGYSLMHVDMSQLKVYGVIQPCAPGSSMMNS
jgi:hypothetical protein